MVSSARLCTLTETLVHINKVITYRSSNSHLTPYFSNGKGHVLLGYPSVLPGMSSLYRTARLSDVRLLSEVIPHSGATPLSGIARSSLPAQLSGQTPLSGMNQLTQTIGTSEESVLTLFSLEESESKSIR